MQKEGEKFVVSNVVCLRLCVALCNIMCIVAK